jgi:ribosomal protein S20
MLDARDAAGAETLLKTTTRAISHATQKGVVPKQTAPRRISRLT